MKKLLPHKSASIWHLCLHFFGYMLFINEIFIYFFIIIIWIYSQSGYKLLWTNLTIINLAVSAKFRSTSLWRELSDNLLCTNPIAKLGYINASAPEMVVLTSNFFRFWKIYFNITCFNTTQKVLGFDTGRN